MKDREITAMIAYLQRLGVDTKVKNKIMLKFVKHNMETIDGVSIYPIISLSIFL